MDIGRVDVSATHGTSALHRTAPVAKLVAFALVLGAVVITANVLVLAGVLLALVAVTLGHRLPARPMFALAAYPGLFAGLFAFAASAELLSGAVIVLKAVTAALAAVLLMFTTPYPQVFAPVQRVLPAVLGDIILMTYRSLFLLIDAFSHTLRAARLRAGLVGVQPIRSARTVTRTLGGVLLYSIDLSQRTYDIMRLRGYDGRLTVSPQRSVSRLLDARAVLFGATVLALALAWRLGWRNLNPYSWLPVLLGGLALIAGLVLAARKER